MIMFVVLMIGLAAVGAVLSGIWEGRRDEARLLRFQPAANPSRVAVRQTTRGAYEAAAGDELMAEIEEWLCRQR
jgi:hypothetical protein